VEYRWRFSDGTTLHGSVAEYEFQSPGEYTVQLQITTKNGDIATTSRAIVILDAIVVPGSFSRIQQAIDAACSGDTIVVMPGIYRESIRIHGKTIILRSSDPTNPDIVHSTILGGVEYGRPTINIGDGSVAVIDGFTIRPGAVDPDGDVCGVCTGTIYVREASPTIRNNRIIGAIESGIVLYESAAHIEGNLFLDCSSAYPGGAIAIDSYLQGPTIIDNTFDGNSAPSGGAIFITATSVKDLTPGCAAPTTIANNDFHDNESTQFGGGAIFVEYAGSLCLPKPDTNKYVGNEPNDIFYVVPQ